MNADRRKEELLREAAAYGDVDNVTSLVETGVDLNAQHNLNGWTALHWAAKRGHSTVVQYLLHKGADPCLKSLYGESAYAVAKNEEIRELLSGSFDTSEPLKAPSLPITPNYIKNQPLDLKLQVPQDLKISQESFVGDTRMDRKIAQLEEELVLKVRTSDPPNQDFIEIEVPLSNLTYESLFKISCEELQVLPKNVLKIRKLPNTIMRKDKDIQRLQNFQELELVTIGSPNSNPIFTNSIARRLEVNGINRSSSEVVTSPFASNSSYCKNGTILY